MILTISNASSGMPWSVQLNLDFNLNSWSVAPNQPAWDRIAGAKQGSFERKAGGNNLWLYDRFHTLTRRIAMILWDSPTHAKDTTHKAGGGLLHDPKDPKIKDQRISWKSEDTSIRAAAMKLLAQNLPPLGAYDPPDNFVEKTKRKGEKVNADGNRATGCGGLVGRYYEELERLGWPIPKTRVTKTFQWTPPGKSEKVTATETLYLTGVTFGHVEVVEEIQRGRQKPIYIKFKDHPSRRPLPGDVYIINAKGIRRHEGVIVDASTNEWITADGGQGNSGFDVGYSKKRFDPATGEITGAREPGFVAGWIDLEELVKPG
jgi:hypothetical protein